MKYISVHRFSFRLLSFDVTNFISCWQQKCQLLDLIFSIYHFGFRFLKDMSSFKVTILITQETQEALVQYRMVLFKAGCFGGYV